MATPQEAEGRELIIKLRKSAEQTSRLADQLEAELARLRPAAPIIARTMGETVADFESAYGITIDHGLADHLLAGIAAAVKDRTGRPLFAPSLRPAEEVVDR